MRIKLVIGKRLLPSRSQSRQKLPHPPLPTNDINLGYQKEALLNLADSTSRFQGASQHSNASLQREKHTVKHSVSPFDVKIPSFIYFSKNII